MYMKLTHCHVRNYYSRGPKLLPRERSRDSAIIKLRCSTEYGIVASPHTNFGTL